MAIFNRAYKKGLVYLTGAIFEDLAANLAAFLIVLTGQVS